MKQNKIKQTDKANVSSNYFLILLCLCAFTIATEYYISYLIFLEKISLITFLIIHLIISILLLTVCLIIQFLKIDKRLFLYLFFLTLITGILGSIICFITAITCWIFYRNADLNWLFDLSLLEEETENEKLYFRLLSSQEDFTDKSNLASLSDVITGGTTHQKRLVIAKIAKYFSPNLAKLLRQAVTNKENSIRVQAATVIANIESTFSKKLIALESSLKNEPKNPEVLYSLAQHCDTYAYCGILTDESYINEFYKKAIEYYSAYQKVTSKNSKNIDLTLGRLYLRINENQKALKKLNLVLKAQENNYINPQIFLWYLEVLYRLKEYAKLSEFCIVYKDKINGDAAAEIMAMESVTLWTKPNET